MKNTPDRRATVAGIIKDARTAQSANARTENFVHRAAESLDLAETAFRAKDTASARQHIEAARRNLSPVIAALATDSAQNAATITQLEAVHRAL